MIMRLAAALGAAVERCGVGGVSRGDRRYRSQYVQADGSLSTTPYEFVTGDGTNGTTYTVTEGAQPAGWALETPRVTTGTVNSTRTVVKSSISFEQVILPKTGFEEIPVFLYAALLFDSAAICVELRMRKRHVGKNAR